MRTLDAKSQALALKRTLKISLFIHLGVFAVLIMKSIFFHDQAQVYLPSLKVDLVALPDHKINQEPKPSQPVPIETPSQKSAIAPIVESKIETKPEEKGDFVLQKKKSKKQTAKEKAAQKKMKDAIARIKSLERIKAMSEEPVKGNEISKGSSISGEAKTALETSYFDVVLERVRNNWELPKWLQDQNLSAKVLIMLNYRGEVTAIHFTHPSGNEAFDNEVKRTLTIASPFPAPPSEILSDVSEKGILLGFPI